MKFYFENRAEMMDMVKKYMSKHSMKKVADAYWTVILKSEYTDTEYTFCIA